jgi:uncharacterized protein (TIGR02117 family)
MFLLKNSIRTMFIFLGAFLLFVIGYFICAFVFARIPVNTHPNPDGEVTLFILTNGVHTDLILPVKSEAIDWSEWFPYAQTIGNDTTHPLVAIGWGDRGFYLNTPTWSDLTFKTAFNAVFGLGTTAVHATYHAKLDDHEQAIKMKLSLQQYKQLISYITKSLTLDPTGKPIHIQTTANYGDSDAFYESNGRYSLFFTCNTWTNNALKSCGQKACFWTPFQSGIFYQYR